MVYFIIAALIVLFDQLIKYYVTIQLTPGVDEALIPGFIHLSYQENTGVAFSFLSDMRWLLVIVSVVVIVLIVAAMIWYKDKLGRTGKLALAAVLGGAVSHLFDRAVFGYVVDFFKFDFVRFAVFDVADCFITVGGIVFCLYYLFFTAKHDRLRTENPFGKHKKSKENINESESADDINSGEGTPEDDGGSDKT